MLAQRVDELEEALKKKDEEMKQMEERYKKYLEKAKSVSEVSVKNVYIFLYLHTSSICDWTHPDTGSEFYSCRLFGRWTRNRTKAPVRRFRP